MRPMPMQVATRARENHVRPQAYAIARPRIPVCRRFVPCALLGTAPNQGLILTEIERGKDNPAYVFFCGCQTLSMPSALWLSPYAYDAARTCITYHTQIKSRGYGPRLPTLANARMLVDKPIKLHTHQTYSHTFQHAHQHI